MSNEPTDSLDPPAGRGLSEEVDPRRLGDFLLLGEIGRGGMGVVYEARQISIDRRVALKVLAPQLSFSPVLVERFRREAKAAARMDSDGVVKVFAVGTDGGTHYMAMEFVAGAPLELVIELARATPLRRLTGSVIGHVVEANLHRPSDAAPGSGTGSSSSVRTDSEAWEGEYVATAVSLIAQVADALHEIHLAGIVHRDVKPSNILVRGDGTVVLTDFGLARDESAPALTLSGEFAGTPHYTAPEQARGEAVDPRTDVFALGATLFELLTLERPFDGATIAKVLEAVLERDPPDVHERNPRVPRDLSAIVSMALEKDPDRRYLSAEAMAADLWTFLAGEPVVARPVSAWTRLLRWSRRERTLAASIAIVTLALGATYLLTISFVLDARANERIARAAEAEARDARQDAIGAGQAAESATRDAEEKSEQLARQRAAADAARALAEAAEAEARAENEEREQRRADLLQANSRLEAELNRKRHALEQRRLAADQARQERQRRIEADAGLRTAKEKISDFGARRERRERLRSHPTLTDQLHRLRERAHELWPLDSELAPKIVAWLDEAKTLVDERADLRRALGELPEDAKLTEEDRRLRDAGALLLEDLDAFVSGPAPSRGIAEFIGSSYAEVARRSTVLAEIEDRSVSSESAVAAWREATDFVARSRVYRRASVELAPIFGFLPIGEDRDSGLYEFALLCTGDVPERDRNGRLVLTEMTGLVFVLLPGGRFWMGAEPRGNVRNRDPQAGDDEGPVHEVELAPFLLSKYEVTQAQWLRLRGTTPMMLKFGSFPPAKLVSPVFPERAPYVDCLAAAAQLGMELPTEAQWEYACRAGTRTPWWCGSHLRTLRGKANLADRTLLEASPDPKGLVTESELDDGFALLAPVGSFDANPFGLHDMLGNEWEWCRDPFLDYEKHRARAADGERSAPSGGELPGTRVLRGGSFATHAKPLRSAARRPGSQEMAPFAFRPSRTLR